MHSAGCHMDSKAQSDKSLTSNTNRLRDCLSLKPHVVKKFALSSFKDHQVSKDTKHALLNFREKCEKWCNTRLYFH